MTYTPLDETDIHYRSNWIGAGGSLSRQIPSDLSTSSSGNGAVTPGKYGATISPGGSIDDVARISGAQLRRRGSNPFAGVVIVYQTRGTSGTFNDSWELGLSGGIGDSESIALDLTNEQYITDAASQPAQIPNSGFDKYALIITVNHPEGQTTFQHTGADVDETVVVDGAGVQGRVNDGIVEAQSNGNDENLEILYARQFYQPAGGIPGV